MDSPSSPEGVELPVGARRVMARCRIDEGSLLVLDVVDDGIGVIDSPTAAIGLESVTASGGVWQFQRGR